METADHELAQSFDMTFVCKKCKKAFRKDAREFEERCAILFTSPRRTMLRKGSDEYCPHCDNHFVLDALTPKAELRVEGEDARKDARYAPSRPGPNIYTDLLSQDAQGRPRASRGGKDNIQRQGCPRPLGLRRADENPAGTILLAVRLVQMSPTAATSKCKKCSQLEYHSLLC